jgi:hypothetical protein
MADELEADEWVYADERPTSGGQRSKIDRYQPQTTARALPNPLAKQEKLALKLDDRSDRLLFGTDWYFIFVPEQTRRLVAEAGPKRAKVNVSILFCVDYEMATSGLRHFFKDRDDCVLITVPGIEPDADEGITRRWGVGITLDQVKSLLAAAKLDADPVIQVLAAYSTGYHGMQRCILLDTLPLGDIHRIIYYDCLVRADEYPAAMQTVPAIQKLMRKDRPREIVIYDVTEGGTKRYKGNKVSPDGDIALTAQVLGASKDKQIILKHIQLTHRAPVTVVFFLQALVYARTLLEAKNRGVKLTIPKSIDAITRLLPIRGAVASDDRVLAERAKLGKVLLTKWGSDHKIKPIPAVDLKRANEAMLKHDLVGGEERGPDALTAEVLHQQFMAEFAWEYLGP